MPENMAPFFEIIFKYTLPLTVFFGSLFIGIILRGLIFRRLNAWSQSTQSRLDDLVVDAIRGPFMIWCLMLGIYLALNVSTLSQEVVALAGKILLILGILSVTIVLANVSGKAVSIYSSKIDAALPVTSLTNNLTRIIIFGIGILIILNSMGVSVTPILATLGVGGLAVALALQDTLSNLFAGLHVIVARQVKIGDYIKLETGEEGYVIDINWRTTQIRMLPNNVVLVPNAKLSQAIVTNYYLPDKELAVLVQVGVHYHSDLKKVERVTCEVGKEVMKEVPGGVENFDPFIRYHTFADSSINFTVILRAKEFVDQYVITHEFIKRLHERYQKENITIPYPMRTVTYEDDSIGAGKKR